MDDIVKNLFRILCEIIKMPLQSRGLTPIKTDILYESLDTVNFTLLDNDLIVLNQMATLKGLCNRCAFTLTPDLACCLHDKFKNLCNQREEYIRKRDTGNGKEYRSKRPHDDLPNDFNIHELEENREFRNSAYYHDKYNDCGNQR